MKGLPAHSLQEPASGEERAGQDRGEGPGGGVQCTQCTKGFWTPWGREATPSAVQKEMSAGGEPGTSVPGAASVMADVQDQSCLWRGDPRPLCSYSEHQSLVPQHQSAKTGGDIRHGSFIFKSHIDTGPTTGYREAEEGLWTRAWQACSEGRIFGLAQSF